MGQVVSFRYQKQRRKPLPMKTYLVFSNLCGLVGRVSADRKGQAMFLAERDLRVQPGTFYVAVE